MLFFDNYDGRTYTAADLLRTWKTFRAEDPVNHAEKFIIEFFEIILAAINGRNDFDIVGLTHAELDRFIIRLRARINKDMEG